MKAMISKPYAKVLREALPNATFVGFTGTPIAETYQTFGDEIDRYTMDQAVADKITVPIKYHSRIAKVLLNAEKAKEIEAYYAKCADEGSTKEDIAKSKKAMSSLEMILGEPDRLEKLAIDIHDHYVSSVANDPDRVQKAMIVCANRKIAYDLLLKFKAHYPEWFEERKTPEGIIVSAEKLKELKEMPTIAMVASVGSNDEADMYNYLGGVKNDKRSEELDAAFKQEHSNFRVVIVVDMWITGFDVECLTYMYNDKPLQKHSLIQTISRANRKYQGKEYGLIVDYIGIRDQMMEARKMYGGDNSVALTEDDIEQATLIFREYMEILKVLFKGYDLTPFLNIETDSVTRYTLLAKAAEYVFSSNESFNSVNKDGKKTKKVSFKTYFLQNVKRMRKAYDLCQPSGELHEEESALAQCFMAIAGMVYKMNGTDAPDTDTMNRRVAKMVEEALKYNNVESILEEGEEMDIFGPEFTERLEDIKMPASKLETLIKLLRKQITEYGKTNQVAAKKFQEMLEATIQEYHDRRKFLSEEEAGETQEATAESIIMNATEQALNILKGMQADRESFRKLGLTFEEKAFYDILIHLRDKNNFVYGEDKEVDGIVINEKCKSLACKIRDIIDTKSSFADWLNNQRVRDQLKQDIKICLVKNGYPPQYTPEVFREVMEQVENFKENEFQDHKSSAQGIPYASLEQETGMMMAAEDIFIYGSIPVDLPDTKHEDLIDEKLNLILMYAIGSGARQKTETAGKIALGIKESMLNDEQIAAYKSIKYLMFHYWSNPKAYQLTSEPMFVDKNAVPEDYLIRLEKDAVKFLLVEYNPLQSVDLGNINILKTQRKGEIRYLPFVTTLESIKDE
jgi:type I restriction enzyme R subunit